MGKLDGKTALITGGTSGIGEACAFLFAQEGARVIVVGRNEEKGLSTVENAKKQGLDIHFLPCNVTDENDVRELKEKVEKEFGRLDILVNNAGVLIIEELQQIKEESWDLTFDTNVKSTMLMSKHFMETVIQSRGNILNVASIDGLDCNIRGSKNYMYSSSKAALIHFTKYCALNYSDRIRVNCLCPGVTKTPIWTNRDFSRFNSSIPMGRVGEPEEIAKAALFLVSEDAAYITGAVLPVDGGAALM